MGGAYNISLNLPRILSDTSAVETSWDAYAYTGNIFSRRVKNLDTTIVINNIRYDSTIVIEYYKQQINSDNFKIPFMRTYFTKGIGITREETLTMNFSGPPIFYTISLTKNLQNYHIGH